MFRFILVSEERIRMWIDRLPTTDTKWWQNSHGRENQMHNFEKQATLGTYGTVRRQQKTEHITEYLKAELQQPRRGKQLLASYMTPTALLIYIVKFGKSRVGDRGKN